METGDEVFLDDDDDIDEHVVPKQSVTDVVFEANTGECPINLEELRSELNEELDVGQSQTPVRELTKDEKIKLWFKREEKKEVLAIKKSYKSPAAKDLKRGIINWFFDADLQLFVLKRYDGLQYLKKKLKVFNSLPKCELKELAWKELINQGNDPYAEVIA